MHGKDIAGATRDPDTPGFAYVEEIPKLSVPFCVVDDMAIGNGTPWAYYFYTMQLAKTANEVDSRV